MLCLSRETRLPLLNIVIDSADAPVSDVDFLASLGVGLSITFQIPTVFSSPPAPRLALHSQSSANLPIYTLFQADRGVLGVSVLSSLVFVSLSWYGAGNIAVS